MTLTEQQKKNLAVIELLDEWMADDSGYDEENWPQIKKAIEENTIGGRKVYEN